MTPPITEFEYSEFITLIHQITGIVLDASKKYLVETRLGPLIEENGMSSYRQLIDQAKQPNSKIQIKVIDAITTNETFFFREAGAFELLRRKAIPHVMDRLLQMRSNEPMRIWSAACSSGQEMYSIALSALEFIGSQGYEKIRIDGTDISEQILTKASMGIFTQFEINRGMPANLLGKYFNVVSGGYRVKDEVRAMCRFERANLLRISPPITKYDVIFCRNVAIYFSPTERASMFRTLAKSLAPQGMLIVGSTEQIRDCDDVLKLMTDFPGCYYYMKV